MDFPSVEGELRCDEEALAAAARDFGRHASYRPIAVLVAASYEDVATAVRFAAERRLRVVTRGHRRR